MDCRLPLREALASWEVPPLSPHVAISALFDLLHETLPALERQTILDHLTQCQACSDLAQVMVQPQDAPVQSLLEAPLPLAAATPPSDEASDDLLLSEDEHQKVHFIRSLHGAVTFLTIEVKPAFRRDLEGKEVTIYLGDTLVCQGVIQDGTVSWKLPQPVRGALRLVYE